MISILLLILRIILWILLALLVTVFLLSLIKINIDISYDGSFRTRIRILFYRRMLYPEPVKKVNVRKFTYRRYLKRIAREQRKADKAKRKADEAARKKAAEELTKKKRSVRAILRIVIYLLRRLPQRLLRCFRFDFHTLSVTVGTDDAAKTAIRYGYVVQSVAYLLAFLEEWSHLTRQSRNHVYVGADFFNGKTDYKFSLTLSTRLIRVLPFAVTALLTYRNIRQESEGETDINHSEKRQISNQAGHTSGQKKTDGHTCVKCP